MADKEDIQKRLEEDEDFIRSPKFSNSLTRFLAKHPDGIENAQIARLLGVTEERVEELFAEAATMLREEMSED